MELCIGTLYKVQQTIFGAENTVIELVADGFMCTEKALKLERTTSDIDFGWPTIFVLHFENSINQNNLFVKTSKKM